MNEIDRTERLQRLSPVKRALLLNAAREKIIRAQQAQAITRRPQNGPAVLSYAQQGLWFFEQLEPGSSVFNTPVTVRFEGKLNLPALQDSLREIARRHQILHTIFIVVDNEPMQAVLPDFNVHLPLVDLESLPDAERDVAFRLINHEVNRPFNLGQDPLLRVTMLRLDREQYILPLTLHHLVGDAWSRGILVEELKALYNAFANGMPSPLSELPIQYADYAEWQRAWLTGEILDQQLGYWKQQLDAAAEPVELPTDHPRPPVQTYHGAKESFSLSRTQFESLKTMSQHEGVTPFMTLLAAFNTLLHRYTGQTDISLGTPAANRNRIEVERLIGLFANVLVLRTDLSGHPTFRELLLRVRRVALEAYTNQDVPFEKLVAELQPERTLSHHPLFQIMFVFENARMEALELPGVVMSRVQTQRDTAHFELQIILTETGMGLAGSVEYNGDLFEPATINRLARHYERVLAAVVRDPQQELWQLPLLSEAEQYQLLVEWNETSTAGGQGLGHCLHELFEQQVERGPERVAVVFGEQQLSYGELDRRANQLAHYLRGLGVGPEVLVGLCMERSLEMVVGLLGILKAGGAYVPLDPGYPEQRLSFMLADAQAPVLLTNQNKQPWTGQLTAVDLSRDWAAISNESEARPHVEVSSENAAYVIYTSGSTGRPKGVVLRHGGAVELMQWAEVRFRHEGLAAVLASTSICFDLSVFELFAPLSCGGKVVLIESVLRLPEGLQLPEVTLINTVPSAAAMLVRAGALPASASVVNVAGEPLARELVEALYATGSVKQVLNLYGPTEDTTYSTGAMIVAGCSEQPPIGRPLRGRQSYVLDQHMQAAPIGVRGELYLGGNGLARGYWKRPALTAEKFVPHPFSKEEGGERLYKTGDQGRHLGDGQLAFFGRADHQVKLRGYRIELGEIEMALRSWSEVQDAVVVVQEAEQRLVGYVVRAEGGEPLTMNQWRNRLSGQLPEYMIPSVLVELPTLPLLPNGKLDRRALPEPEGTVTSKGERQLARTMVEELLANIWAEVLHLDQVGVNENFFELGGHSLLAAQVAARVQQVLGVKMPLRWMFEAPVVESLSARIESEQREEEKPLLARPELMVGPMPLSFAQERLWFLEQLAPGRATYNIASGVDLRGVLQLTAISQSLREVVRRHAMLRTSFINEEGQPAQLIEPEARVSLGLVDLQGLHGEAQQAMARRLAREEVQRPFELTQGPLLRVRLLRLGAKHHQLLFVMHHIVSDGWSLGVLVREVVSLYEALVAGRPSALPELAVQYADYAVWQREWLQSEVLTGQLEYWKQQLGGAPEVLELPTDRRRPPQQSFRGGREEVTFGEQLTQELDRLSRQQGVTVFMTLVAAFESLLHRYTGQTDLLIGTTIAGRNRVEIEPLIGFFVNTLVLRTQLSAGMGFEELLAQVREVALQAQAHQDVPFERLVQELAVERSLSHTPLFQVMVTLDNTPRQVVEVAGLSLETLSGDKETAKFDLTLALNRSGRGALFGAVEYSSDLFEPATIKRLARHYERVLAAVVRDPEQELWQLPLLSEAEQYQLLVEWNETSTAGGQGLGHCLHELFEQQVERSPERVAVVFGEQQLSYGELDRRANQLAHYLRGLGVGPEVLVGLCMERSLEMVVGLLGILKAGGAYVPLDPGYPEQRLSFMLADAQAPVLLTNQNKQPWTGQLTAVDLSRDWAAISNESEEQPHVEVSSENVAYMIYTSGSTGRPKGVMISHGAISNLLFWLRTTFGLDENDVVLQKTPCSFDASVWEFYAPLLTGGRLIMAIPGGQQDSPYLVQVMREQEVTIIHLVPSLLGMLLAEDGLSACHNLRYVFPGGEILPLDMQERFLERLTAKLCNLYGPTEATIDSTFHVCQPGALTVPIGRPITNTQIYLLDSNLQTTPQGVPGEIYIGGAGVARGYHNRPELTAAAFIPDPFCGASDRRLYKTGDLGRYLPDGSIEFLERVDHQVKLRGYRIELGEIEAVLRSQPEVQNAVVVMQEAEQRLVGYVVCSERTEPLSISEWRNRLSRQLPVYMIPSVMVELRELPLLPNGKLDRRALPPPESNRAQSDKLFVAPRTPVERDIAALWTELLGVEQVSIYDNFFELGGHSLLLTQLGSRIRSRLYVEVPLRRLFEASTILEMTKVVAECQAQQHDPTELAQMLKELSVLSSDQIKAMLMSAELAN